MSEIVNQMILRMKVQGALEFLANLTPVCCDADKLCLIHSETLHRTRKKNVGPLDFTVDVWENCSSGQRF